MNTLAPKLWSEISTSGLTASHPASWEKHSRRLHGADYSGNPAPTQEFSLSCILIIFTTTVTFISQASASTAPAPPCLRRTTSRWSPPLKCESHAPFSAGNARRHRDFTAPCSIRPDSGLPSSVRKTDRCYREDPPPDGVSLR